MNNKDTQLKKSWEEKETEWLVKFDDLIEQLKK